MEPEEYKKVCDKIEMLEAEKKAKREEFEAAMAKLDKEIKTLRAMLPPMEPRKGKVQPIGGNETRSTGGPLPRPR